MTLSLSLVVLGAVASVVTSQCPPLPKTVGITTVTVEWEYDMWSDQCKANRRGSREVTRFNGGQQKVIEDLGQPCLVFICDHKTKTLRLKTSKSSCSYKDKCTKVTKYRGVCEEPYTCYNDVYAQSQRYSYDDWYRYRSAWFSVFTGFTCGNIGSGPCETGQCFNPFADPKGLSLTTGPTCVEVGGQVVNKDTQLFQCRQVQSACGGPQSSFTDLVHAQKGCTVNGSFVSAGTVTWSDACSQTVCDVSTDVGQRVTSFKDGEGCVYEDQCIALGDKFDVRTNFTCAEFRCRKDRNRENPYYFQITDKGCLHEGQCYREGRKMTSGNDSCSRTSCRKDQSGNFFWDREMKGCHDPSSGECLKDRSRFTLDDCVVNTCLARQNGRWRTDYKNNGQCAPKGGECYRKNGLPGCKHKGRCYAVKSVMTVDECLQYVCYSDDQDLNSGQQPDPDSPSPEWRPRATGCYGPGGCMSLGEQFVDPFTLNTYRCDFHLGGFGIKRPQFHKACVAPSGQSLQLGQSLLLGTVWFSCYQNGVIKNPIDRSEEFVPGGNNHTCGINPDTGKPLFRGEYYYSPEGRCRRVGYHCELDCQYFDQPCTQTDLTPYRYIGDAFTLNDTECVCTQDYKVNNQKIPRTGSLFNTPSLCAEEGVRGGACRDPRDGSVHQWGELWEQSRGNKICTCHPLSRQAFCSAYLPDVTSVLEDMQI